MSDTATLPKVSSAKLDPPLPSGGIILMLKTTEDVEAQFFLDDVAFTLLALTTTLSTGPMNRRLEGKPENVFKHEKEESK